MITTGSSGATGPVHTIHLVWSGMQVWWNGFTEKINAKRGQRNEHNEQMSEVSLLQPAGAFGMDGKS